MKLAALAVFGLLGCVRPPIPMASAPTTGSAKIELLGKIPTQAWLDDVSDDDRSLTLVVDTRNFTIVNLNAKGKVARAHISSPDHETMVHHARFQPGSKLIASDDAFDIAIWETASGKRLSLNNVAKVTRAQYASVSQICWSSSGKTLFAWDEISNIGYAFRIRADFKLELVTQVTTRVGDERCVALYTSGEELDAVFRSGAVYRWKRGEKSMKKIIGTARDKQTSVPLANGAWAAITSRGVLSRGGKSVQLGDVWSGVDYVLSGDVRNQVGVTDAENIWLFDPKDLTLRSKFPLRGQGSTALGSKTGQGAFLVDWNRLELFRVRP